MSPAQTRPSIRLQKSSAVDAITPGRWPSRARQRYLGGRVHDDVGAVRERLDQVRGVATVLLDDQLHPVVVARRPDAAWMPRMSDLRVGDGLGEERARPSCKAGRQRAAVSRSSRVRGAEAVAPMPSFAACVEQVSSAASRAAGWTRCGRQHRPVEDHEGSAAWPEASSSVATPPRAGDALLGRRRWSGSLCRCRCCPVRPAGTAPRRGHRCCRP